MKSINSAYFVNAKLALHSVIDLRVLYLVIDLKIVRLVPPYNWLVTTTTHLWGLKIKSPIGSRPTSYIVTDGNVSLLGNIINESQIYGGSSMREIVSREIILYY